MQRVFLDANVLFAAAYRPDSGLLRLWELKGIVLLTSAYAAEEARRNLSDEAQRRALERLLAGLDVRPEGAPLPLPRGIDLPEKDAPILLAAIAARATHLITGDVRHFGRYLGKRVQGVRILTPAGYLAARSARRG